MSRLLPLALFALLAPNALIGCGDSGGPALRVSLQVVRADPSLDTSDIVNFLVRINDTEEKIDFRDDATIDIVLVDPPQADTSFVVFACQDGGSFCNESIATFVGCTVEDLAPSDQTTVVTVELDAIDPLPSNCVGFVTRG